MPKSKEEKANKLADLKEKQMKRIEPDLKSDFYSETEQEAILTMVDQDVEADEKVLAQWKIDRATDLDHYDAKPPSILENVTKQSWQSDRNLGLCPAIIDTYDAVLLATTTNIENITFKATEKNDIDHKENLEVFTKWGLGREEANFRPEADEYIHNKITLGLSWFKIYWKVWYEWVDRHIPKGRSYEVKTEKKRFEKGIIENISSIDDILIPRYGKKVQDLPHIVHVIHKYGYEMKDLGRRKVFMNVTDEYIEKLKHMVLSSKKAGLERKEAELLNLTDVTDEDLRALPLDLHQWYGVYTKNGRTEKYRFTVDLNTKTFLSGKPVRKINRTGKYPFVGGGFIRKPGKIPGKSLTRLISPAVNAFNNVYNQKSDFQYVTNCPFGFYVPKEGYNQQEYVLTPMTLYPIADGPLNENVMFPNIQRSMAWAESDIRIIFEVIEKLTGAASYFLTSERGISGTATRDTIVNEKSETRFGLWVVRILEEFGEAITMWVQLYQDKAPPKLGDRVLGDNGKRLFRNLSIESLRGNYGAVLSEDLTAGSKMLERQTKMWALEKLPQAIWLQPQVNPKGNYKLYADAAKVMGFPNPERYLGPEPQAGPEDNSGLKDEWTRISQGEEFDPPETGNPMARLEFHMQKRDRDYHELDPEYKPIFDKYLFKVQVQFQQFVRNMQQQMMADRLAMGIVNQRAGGNSGKE